MHEALQAAETAAKNLLAAAPQVAAWGWELGHSQENQLALANSGLLHVVSVGHLPGSHFQLVARLGSDPTTDHETVTVALAGTNTGTTFLLGTDAESVDIALSTVAIAHANRAPRPAFRRAWEDVFGEEAPDAATLATDRAADKARSLRLISVMAQRPAACDLVRFFQALPKSKDWATAPDEAALRALGPWAGSMATRVWFKTYRHLKGPRGALAMWPALPAMAVRNLPANDPHWSAPVFPFRFETLAFRYFPGSGGPTKTQRAAEWLRDDQGWDALAAVYDPITIRLLQAWAQIDPLTEYNGAHHAALARELAQEGEWVEATNVMLQVSHWNGFLRAMDTIGIAFLRTCAAESGNDQLAALLDYNIDLLGI